jgi:6-aminohexanoate-oligomer endohydrolase
VTVQVRAVVLPVRQAGRARGWLVALALLMASATARAAAPQDVLEPLVNAPGPALEFDWPMIRVGTASYEAGPTGVTVIEFERKVFSAIDVRGTPGTVNAPYMDLLYDLAELDTVVFAGGSWYGLEAVTAVASALKDDGVRDGNAFGVAPSIAMSVGSIIFDFGSRRLNEIYPDKRLAQAAYRATVPGRFPLGATGAGRFARTGEFFGCNAYSGQGGAFREEGDLKIAAFAVVNAYGVVTDRDGRVAACYPAPGWPEDLRTTDLFEELPAMRLDDGSRADGSSEKPANTTVSLVVTNQKLTPVELKRLAVQVHTSIARAVQPFTTMYDGDVLYAVSTAELEEPVLTVPDLGAVASEVMWDAILSSVPEQPQPVAPADDVALNGRAIARLTGDYRFSPQVTVRITAERERLMALALGERNAYAISRKQPVALAPVSATEFTIPGRYPLLLRFDGDGRLVINPGHWQQVGRRIAP